jgi:hypothetical protein
MGQRTGAATTGEEWYKGRDGTKSQRVAEDIDDARKDREGAIFSSRRRLDLSYFSLR